MKQLRTVGVFVKVNTLRFFRDPLALFFTIAFPLIFLFVFGGLFGNSGGLSLKIAVINQSDTQPAKNFVEEFKKNKVFKVNEDVKTIDAAKERMNRGELDATIVLPDSFGAVKEGAQQPTGEAKVIYTQNNQQAGQTLGALLDGAFKQTSNVAAPFTVKTEQTNDHALSAFDYTFSGLLGFSIIGLGIFGPINVFPELKKQGILRRLSTTPLKVWQFFLSNMVTQAIVGLVTMAIMFVVAVLVFHLNIVGNVAEIGLFITFGIIMILGIGLALGGWAKNERQVAPLANLVTFPMMFLSGTFFPRFLMPEWLQTASSFLPLTPVVDGIRLMLTEGKHLVDVAPQLGLMGIWTLVIYIIAFRVFRWE
jgi:ABC-2 type transport system permease protein